MAEKYETLGDIAEGLRRMRADGMTREAVEYALSQVYWVDSAPGGHGRIRIDGGDVGPSVITCPNITVSTERRMVDARTGQVTEDVESDYYIQQRYTVTTGWSGIRGGING